MVTLDQAGRNPGVTAGHSARVCVDAFVHSVSAIRPALADASSRSWRIVADDAPHIVLSFLGGTHRLVIVGARRMFADIDTSRRSLTIVARLHPGAIPPLLRVPANELTDRAYSLEDMLSPRSRAAALRLVECAEQAPIAEMLAFLQSVASSAPPIDSRVRAMAHLSDRADVDVATVATASGIGVRRLRTVMWREVGMGPKRAMRIRRLHRALDEMLGPSPSSLAHAAASAGFSDQAHFTRECRELLGESPGVFARRRA